MRVNEIFYSIQGEGHYTGTPAVFVRLAGCNLNCWFCDTEFHSFTEMSEDEIVAEASQYPSRYMVITGGEPTLQLTASLTSKLHAIGFYIMLETNGTQPLPEGCAVDWITCSPKRPSPTTQHPTPITHRLRTNLNEGTSGTTSIALPDADIKTRVASGACFPVSVNLVECGYEHHLLPHPSF